MRVFSVQSSGGEILPVRSPFETAPKWHILMMIRLPVSMARIKQRTAEYRITKFEGLNRNALSIVIDRIPSFDLPEADSLEEDSLFTLLWQSETNQIKKKIFV